MELGVSQVLRGNIAKGPERLPAALRSRLVPWSDVDLLSFEARELERIADLCAELQLDSEAPGGEEPFGPGRGIPGGELS